MLTPRVLFCLPAIALILGADAVRPAGADETADTLRGYMLGASCLNCHGDGGPDGSGIPSLAGRSAADIVLAMRQFRDGGRGATVMARLARGYSDEEIAELASWLAKRTSSQ